MAHYLIVADGDFLATELIQQLCRDKVIIALDGAADRLATLGIQPAIILGDFDTIQASRWGIEKTFSALDEQDAPYVNAHNILIVPAKNQQYTDLQKAILYCDEQVATDITIICAMGGRLDHQEGNLRTLRWAYKTNRRILLHTNQESICFLRNESYSFSGKPGDKCGLLAFPSGSFTSHGLVYEGYDFPLVFGESESTCNELQRETVAITVTGDVLLIAPRSS